MIDRYNWTNPSLILAHSPVRVYIISLLETKQPNVVHIENDASSLFRRLEEYDCILYTVGLGKRLLRYNYTMEKIPYEEKLNVVYNNGFSYIITKSSNFTWAPAR
jgi:hypothetical protein